MIGFPEAHAYLRPYRRPFESLDSGPSVNSFPAMGAWLAHRVNRNHSLPYLVSGRKMCLAYILSFRFTGDVHDFLTVCVVNDFPKIGRAFRPKPFHKLHIVNHNLSVTAFLN